MVNFQLQNIIIKNYNYRSLYIIIYIVSQALVDGLTILQHRGQDAAGIVTSHSNRLNLRKSTGTVAEVQNIDVENNQI
jgi:glutamine phosphoribosylpyrophosphate amidotransferase